ncbi:fructosamine kinase family protein [Streptomyces sp. DSM 44915]|uniref:Fructosamine kinase family protein n=1 Tax=Streptomyces chisholmiae TaxID=3075540 RepID=A0ABU2JVY3_9ACTN|nr:fructosamine kinase family protein [Streptomyces sp. DSM 44915]MDT0269155.1 fructosamine kinase family protein [Streptomyces sp. DSM 44915]
MGDLDLLTRRLAEAGFDVASVRECTGGVVAVAGVATLSDGGEVFAKCLRDVGTDVFQVEAEGLAALQDIGGTRTPEVRHASTALLVLERRWAHRDGPLFWRRLGALVAALHTSTVTDRFGWHRDGWLGRMRQDNAWHPDGHAFFAERRLLRWLPEPRVAAALDVVDRRALEALCAALPELVPPQPACLTHGDLWAENTLVDRAGAPVLIDPAVSYTWPEVDLSMMWCSPRPPAAADFFTAYGELAPLRDGWRDRMRLLHLRELLSTIAHGDDDWGAAAVVRETVAPFRRRHPGPTA